MRTEGFGRVCRVVLLVWFLAGGLGARAEEKTERFDGDPSWDGHNNRVVSPEPRTIRQDFGFSASAHTGGQAGEMGGFLSPAGEPAYYARKIPKKSFEDALSASGTIVCDGRPLHALIGFFNTETLNEWRTPNTVALRISGRGDVFYIWVEYATRLWRAGGDEPKGFPARKDPQTGKRELVGFASGKAVHHWSLRYDPDANGGLGVVTATVDDQTAVCNLREGHRADGATFNRFGLLTVMKSAEEGGEVWIDDVTVNGETESFGHEPGWDGLRNRSTYVSKIVRPRFDFGFSPTRHAGGQAQGELGGLVFRGDCRYPDRMAYYGDRLETLTLDRPLRASGKVGLTRGVTDSTVLLGFFHSQRSIEVNSSQAQGLPKDFLGVAVEGPSREGFYFAPAYRVDGEGHGWQQGPGTRHIYPDGKPHDWSLEYDPEANEGRGRISLEMDGHPVGLDLHEGDKEAGTRFDRFGIVTTWIDGNGQHIYFDDLTYTARQDRGRSADAAPRTLHGHTGSVLAVAFSPDGATLASCSRDGTVKLWDVKTGAWKQTLTEHTGDVYDVTFSPMGDLLASGSEDKTVRLWNARTGRLVRTLEGHTDIVRSVAFSADQKRLASVGVDRTVRLWDVETGRLLRTLVGHTERVMSVAFSPDGSMLASASSDGSARFWDPLRGTPGRVLEGHAGGLECLAFSPDGVLLATSSQDATVRIWGVKTGMQRQIMKGHTSEIDSVTFSPDGLTVASGCKDTTIKLWDPKTGTLRKTLTGPKNRLESLDFSPDGSVLASGSGGPEALIWLWPMDPPEE